MTDLSSLNEPSRRRPHFSPGPQIVLRNAQTWSFARPRVVTTLGDTEGRLGLRHRWTFGPEIKGECEFFDDAYGVMVEALADLVGCPGAWETPGLDHYRQLIIPVATLALAANYHLSHDEATALLTPKPSDRPELAHVMMVDVLDAAVVPPLRELFRLRTIDPRAN